VCTSHPRARLSLVEPSANANGQQLNFSSFAVMKAAKKAEAAEEGIDMNEFVGFRFRLSPWMVWPAVFAAVWMAAFSASAAEFSGKTSDAAGRAKIRIAVPAPSLSFLPIQVAMRQGFYARRGLDVEMIQMAAGLAVPALLSGSVDYATIPSGPATASARGAPLKVFCLPR